MKYRIRPVSSKADARFLREMSCEAAAWRPEEPRPPLERVLADPHLARYIEDWGGPGDAGAIAEDDRGRPLGAAWYRVFSAEEPGYGFIEPTIPELSIAVRPAARGRGVGTALLAALTERARTQGLAALSLSVEVDNPAVRLYERAGFACATRDENALTMCLDLRLAFPAGKGSA